MIDDIEPVNLKNMSVDECRDFFKSIGEPTFRANQVLEWLYSCRADSYDDMTNLPLHLRETLSGSAPLNRPKVLKKLKASDGTAKYLLELSDGGTVETVVMPHDYGISQCISTQVGCAMKCAFCASGQLGLVRNLELSEMVDQLLVSNGCLFGEERVSSLVLMGMGEPLANYDNVMKFIRLANWQKGFGIGWRHITLSTCGLVPQILKLAEENLQITLSVSLHAPDDETRSAIMPVNRTYGINQLMAACRQYADSTGRRVTYEYILLQGVNDSLRHADKLAGILKGSLSHVNLIPFNQVDRTDFKRPSEETVKAFYDELCSLGVDVTIRREMGSDIDAACGQLRRRHIAAAMTSGGGNE